MVNNIDIGKMIETELKRQGKTVSWLARELGTNRMACYRIFGKQSIDTEVLRRISILLRCDFFGVYSDNIKENIDTQ